MSAWAIVGADVPGRNVSCTPSGVRSSGRHTRCRVGRRWCRGSATDHSEARRRRSRSADPTRRARSPRPRRSWPRLGRPAASPDRGRHGRRREKRSGGGSGGRWEGDARPGVNAAGLSSPTGGRGHAKGAAGAGSAPPAKPARPRLRPVAQPDVTLVSLLISSAPLYQAAPLKYFWDFDQDRSDPARKAHV